MPAHAYISFDLVPAPKGAAVHIEAFTRALAQAFSGVELVTVSPGPVGDASREIWPGVFQTTLPATGPTLIHRVLHFRQHLRAWLAGKRFRTVQIRSIYEGLPVVSAMRDGGFQLIFEVNGLPSIELKYRYPGVADDRELMGKLIAQERRCLDAARLIVTPSAVTRDFLQARGVPAGKVAVIPNGVDLSIFSVQAKREPGSPFRILYAGVLSVWQGLDVLIRAVAMASQQAAVELAIIGPSSGGQREALRKLAVKLGIGAIVQVRPPLAQRELALEMQLAGAIVAPLIPNDRNLVQGCCPLKVLEGMACGAPVIASDMPVVRELGDGGKHFLLVRPRSAEDLKQAILRLASDPLLAASLGTSARRHVEDNFTWERAGAALIAAYCAEGPRPAL